MSEAANNIVRKLAEFGKLEAKALAHPNESLALRRLSVIADQRCSFLRTVARNNADNFGLTEETMALVVAPKDDE